MNKIIEIGYGDFGDIQHLVDHQDCFNEHLIETAPNGFIRLHIQDGECKVSKGQTFVEKRIIRIENKD